MQFSTARGAAATRINAAVPHHPGTAAVAAAAAGRPCGHAVQRTQAFSCSSNINSLQKCSHATAGAHRHVAAPLRAAALVAPTAARPEPDVGVSPAADSIIQYAINLARTSETYEVHSWMILLGILKNETCTAAKVLQSMGLEDLYGAWHEVLWALHVCDGLQARAFALEIKFADRAFKIITASSDFAAWHGKDMVYSEDILMALAAGSVLDGLFPDLNLKFDRVRKAVEKATGRKYQLPGDSADQAPALASEDQIF